MAMTDEHKAALARGRNESRAIKAYLHGLLNRKPGRPVSKSTLTSKIDGLVQKIEQSDDPIETVDLIQRRLDAEKALAELDGAGDMESLEAGFIEHASSYSQRKSVSYTAWREYGVPAKVLRAAGIKETRRRS
jgi:hypothetical protein